jgi:hypothetical protein
MDDIFDVFLEARGLLEKKVLNLPPEAG